MPNWKDNDYADGWRRDDHTGRMKAVPGEGLTKDEFDALERGQLDWEESSPVKDGVKGVTDAVGNVVRKGADKARDVRNYADMYNYLKRQVDAIGQETDEQKAARERRERRTMWLSHLADGLGTFHTAYSHAAGVQPMALTNMSDKARAIYDRALARRQGDEERRLRYLQMMDNMRRQAKQDEYNNQLMEWRRDDLERKKVNDGLAVRKQDWLEKYQQDTLDIKKEQLEIDRQYKAGLISKMERDAYSRELSAQAAILRAQNAGQGKGSQSQYHNGWTETWERDNRGRPVKHTRTPNNGNNGGSTNNGSGGKTSDNTPPGRREKTQNNASQNKNANKNANNTPPSRRS